LARIQSHHSSGWLWHSKFQMKIFMSGRMNLSLAALLLVLGRATSISHTREAGVGHHHHKHHGHHRHGKGRVSSRASSHQKDEEQSHTAAAATTVGEQSPPMTTLTNTSASAIMQAPLKETSEKTSIAADQGQTCMGTVQQGRLLMNGPLPVDFAERFQQAAAKATGCDPGSIGITSTAPSGESIMIVDFSAALNTVNAVEDQAADPTSQLANGPLRPFLVAKDSEASDQSPTTPAGLQPAAVAAPAAAEPPPPASAGIDIDTEMPYGELEPFGREDTAQELSEQAIKESDSMVDQLERAEVAEEKRAVFRALTRLRGAAIASFDGIARSQTGNIDEYNKVHQWRMTHPLNHLANEESDVSKWAFPDDADF
jgi:hypothetical protein